MITARNLSKRYLLAGDTIQVLQDVSLEIGQGDFLAIVGRSGSGKTTLLNILSTLVKADEGSLEYSGIDLAGVRASRLNELRQRDFSVIFQFHHLLPYLTVLQNTLLPFMGSLRSVDKKTVQKAEACLERIGLKDKLNRLPGKLSGGEQQRVAIARAMVKSSKVLFADEPTGSLDRKTGEEIMRLMIELNEEGLTVIMVTHEQAYADLARSKLTLCDGRVEH